jgi:hypothetical protein
LEEPGAAGRERGEDEVWRDLVARLGVTGEDGHGKDGHGEPSPWPPEEDVESWPDGGRVIRPAGKGTAPGGLTPFTGEQVTAPSGPAEPSDDADDHYIPPPPPPLPRLDNVAKASWLALFGGPAYLLVTTIAGWPISSWAAFLAVAAFVGGFITLVLRMSDEGRDDDPGNGAVV